MRIIQAVPRVARKPHHSLLGNKGQISDRTLSDVVRSRPIASIALRDDLDHLILATPDLIEAGYSDDTRRPRALAVHPHDQPNGAATGRNNPTFEFAIRFATWADSLRKMPSRQDVERRYDISRATACRYLAAYRAARGLA